METTEELEELVLELDTARILFAEEEEEEEEARIVISIKDITTRKQAEEVLRLFKDSVEHSSDAVGMSTPEGKHYYQNEAFERLFGDIGDCPPAAIYVDQTTGKRVFDTIMAGEKWQGEVQMFKKDRTILDILLRAYPIQGKDGRIIGLVGLHTDITARKRTEDALRESEEKHRLLIENSHDIIYMLTADGAFTFVSPAWTALLGHPTTEVVGQSFQKFVHPDDIPACLVWLQKVVKTGERQEGVEYRVRHIDGKWRWHTSSAVPLRDEAGTVVGFEGTARDITKRKLAEYALQESEGRLREVLENSLDASYKRNLRTNEYDYFSPVFALLSGYTPDEMKTLPTETILNFMHPEDRAEVERVIAASMSDSAATAYTVEYRFKHKDGYYRWFRDRFSVMRDAAGNLLSRIGSVSDITESHQTERMLKDIIEKNPMSIQIVDEEGFTLKTNPAHTLLFGAVPPADFSIFADLSHRSQELEKLILLLKKGEVVSFPDSPYNIHDVFPEFPDNPIWVHVIGFPLKGEGSSRGRFVFVHENITERKQVEAEVSFKSMLLQAQSETSIDGILAVDNEGHSLLFNTHFGEMWKIPRQVLDEKDDKRMLECVSKQLKNPEEFGRKVAYLYEHKDEKSRDEIEFIDGRCFDRYSAPLLGVDGKFNGRIWYFRDITERKASEQQLRERTDELTRFTYAVSHDLKSPLVTVKTFLGYLEQDMKSQNADGVAKDLGYIHGATDKMSRLLDELLNLARVGRMMNAPVRVLLQDVAQEALRLAAGRISERGVEVVLAQEPATLFGDRTRLVEVFLNLVDNAVKFMGEQPHPRVEIGFKTQGEETVFFVRDNGIGIDPRHADKLFGLFEKLDASAEGTGLGLALVRRIVEAHGGRIWMESAGPGKGATFLFTLTGAKPPATEANAS